MLVWKQTKSSTTKIAKPECLDLNGCNSVPTDLLQLGTGY